MALGAVGCHHRIEFIQRKKRYRPFAFSGHAGNDRICCVQNGRSFGADVLNDHALENGKLIDRGDVIEAEVIAATHIGNDRDIAAIKRQAFAQHPTAGSFKHCGIDVRVVQHIFRAFGATAVTRINAISANVNAVGIGHANAQALVR